MSGLIRYFTDLPRGKIVLWCYLIWYLVAVATHFDPTPAIWLNALGISAVIGCALMLSVAGPGQARRDPWQTFRLFMMPFGVSSFSALIKGRGYLFVFPPTLAEFLPALGTCAAFVAFVLLLKAFARHTG